MSHVGIQLGSYQELLEAHADHLQFWICVLGTIIGGTMICIPVIVEKTWLNGKITLEHIVFVAIIILGCAAYFGPLRTLNGDGAVHQEKIWYVANALKAGALPDWTFFWFGGGSVSEVYGPAYYIVFALPMILLGLSTKWAIVLIVFACTILSAALTVWMLAPRYGFLAAALASASTLFSPARAATYWRDGCPHRIMIDFICVVYVLYLWRRAKYASPPECGLYLGLASASCVYFHLQLGGIATLILFLFTATVLFFDKPFEFGRALYTCVIGLAVFLPTAGVHYIYYFLTKPDLVADSDSVIYMFSPTSEWISNLISTSVWDWAGKTWDAHYVGVIPLLCCVYCSVLLFQKDRFAFLSGSFCVMIFIFTMVLPRIAMFAPVFFLPAVASAIYDLRYRFLSDADVMTSGRLKIFGLAAALALLLDIYPSNFQLPYRPATGDRPVAEALAELGPSRGRIVVVSPDKQYPNMSADRFKGVPEVASPSIFGPTFQLSTKMLGYAAMIADKAWRDYDIIGVISPKNIAYLGLLDVSDILVYKRNQKIVHLPVRNFRPAWRVGSFVCDPTAGPLTKLNWDEHTSARSRREDAEF